MKIQKLTQYGFAHLLVIVVAVASLGTVGAAGVYVVQAHNASVKKQKLAQLAASSKQQSAAHTTAPPKASNQQPIQPTPSVPQTAPCVPNTTMYVTSTVGLYLRSATSFSSSPLILMPYASAVEAGCLSDGWYAASYGGKTGYASQSYLAATKPAVAAAPTQPSTPPTNATSTPTTVTIGTKTYQCSPGSNDSHWQNLVYTNKSSTYSYSSPGGATLNTYAQWSNITGLSCASTSGWLVRGSEYFWAGDLVIT